MHGQPTCKVQGATKCPNHKLFVLIELIELRLVVLMYILRSSGLPKLETEPTETGNEKENKREKGFIIKH